MHSSNIRTPRTLHIANFPGIPSRGSTFSLEQEWTDFYVNVPSTAAILNTEIMKPYKKHRVSVAPVSI